MRAERILSRWGSKKFFQSRWGSEPNFSKYYYCFLQNFQNLGEDWSSDSHQFRPHCAYKFWPNDSWLTTNILDCSCHFDGSLKTDGSVCISTDPCPCSNDGTCNCGIGFKGDKCDECESGYYDIDVNDSTSGASCTGIYSYNPE